MSIKTFCDYCGVQLGGAMPNVGSPENQLARNSGGVTFRVIAGFNCAPGDLCKYCVIDAVKFLDDRPKEETERKTNVALGS